MTTYRKIAIPIWFKNIDIETIYRYFRYRSITRHRYLLVRRTRRI